MLRRSCLPESCPICQPLGARDPWEELAEPGGPGTARGVQHPRRLTLHLRGVLALPAHRG